MVVHGERTRKNQQKLKEVRFSLDCKKKKKNSQREGSKSERGCSETLCNSSPRCFSRLDWIKPSATWPGAGFEQVVEERPPEVLSNLNQPVIL